MLPISTPCLAPNVELWAYVGYLLFVRTFIRYLLCPNVTSSEGFHDNPIENGLFSLHISLYSLLPCFLPLRTPYCSPAL